MAQTKTSIWTTVKMLLQNNLCSPYRKILFTVVLFLPALDIFSHMSLIMIGGSVYQPDYGYFMMTGVTTLSDWLSNLFIWFLPVYLLVVTVDDCLEEAVTGHDKVLLSRIGKRRYRNAHLLKSFLTAFFLIFTALMINLLLVHIFLRGGQFTQFGEDYSTDAFYIWEKAHPLLANILFAIVFALIAALLSMAGAVLALILKDKKIVYLATILLWYIPFISKKSIALVIQPHSEYLLDTIIPIGLSVSVLYIFVIIMGAGYYMHCEG